MNLLLMRIDKLGNCYIVCLWFQNEISGLIL